MMVEHHPQKCCTTSAPKSTEDKITCTLQYDTDGKMKHGHRNPQLKNDSKELDNKFEKNPFIPFRLLF
jgi:hypothetical protein